MLIQEVGTIILGVKEDKETTYIEGKTIIIINIPTANRQNKPIYENDNPIKGTFKRYHDGDYKCTREEIRVMFSESAEKSKDEIILEEYNIDNIDSETIEKDSNFIKVTIINGIIYLTKNFYI